MKEKRLTQVTIYRDINENGSYSYIVYNGAKCIGSFQGDNPRLKYWERGGVYRKRVEMRDGIDDRH